jgi:hypothetical protein
MRVDFTLAALWDEVRVRLIVMLTRSTAVLDKLPGVTGALPEPLRRLLLQQ